MAIYLLLLCALLGSAFISYYLCDDLKLRNKIILIFTIICLFLIYSLRSVEVGRDIEGYALMYKQYQYASLSNFDLYWTEPGYEFIELIFSKYLHVGFQLFLAIIYAFICVALYCFWIRFSLDTTFSLLIFICFSFFSFSVSALRQMLSIAICLFAYPLANKKGVKYFIFYLLLSFIAYQFHRTACVMIPLYFVIKVPPKRDTYLIYFLLIALLFLFRSLIYSYISENIISVNEVSLSSGIGGNVIFYIITIYFCMTIQLLYRKKIRLNNYKSTAPEFLTDIQAELLEQSLCIFAMGVAILIFSSNTALTRLSQLEMMYLTLVLPNSVALLSAREKLLVKLVFYSFFITCFIKYSLLLNQLNIIPYRFFWK